MAIDAGSISASLKLDSREFTQGLRDADSKAKDFASGLTGMGNVFSDIGNKMTLGVTVPLSLIAKQGLEAGMNFQKGMSEVQAVSGATAEEMALLEQKAKDIGANTKFSASEAAEGLKSMATAGWETGEMLAGIDGVMNLTAASGEELGRVSEIVADGLSAFGLEANEATRLADLLASTSSNANTDVGLMGETFQNVAPVAGALGYSMEDTALAAGILANAGIKGSKAGVALRNIMTNLVKPTDEQALAMKELGISVTDANGEMKPFEVMLKELRSSFSKLTPEQQAQYAATIAGQSGMAGLLAIVNAGEDDFDKLREATTDYTGEAERMASTMEDNVQGQITILKSGLEALAIEGFEMLLPHIVNFVEKLQDLVDYFASLDSAQQENILKWAGLAMAIGPVSKGLGGVFKLAGGLTGGLAKLAGGLGETAVQSTVAGGGLGGFGGIIQGLPALITPTTLAIAGIGLAGIVAAKKLSEDALPEVEIFGEGISETTEKAVGDFLDMSDGIDTELQYIMTSGTKVTEEMKENMLGNINELTEKTIASFKEQKEESLKETKEMLDGISTLTEEEKEKIIEIENKKFEDLEKIAEEGSKRINEIFTKASESNRTLTEKEKEEVTRIREEQKELGIITYSETQQEAEKILNNLKENATNISARQAADVVKNSIEQRDKTIENAEKEYEERIAFANQLKEDGTKESRDMADKIIKEAERQKTDTINYAKETHDRVVDEAKKQAQEHVEQIDWESGELKSKWARLKDWFSNNPIVRWIKTRGEESPQISGDDYGQASGPYGNYASGGVVTSDRYAWVGEQGRELLKIPKGGEVISSQKSEKIAGGGNIENVFEISSLVVREEADIKRIAKELKELQGKDARGKGVVIA